MTIGDMKLGDSNLTELQTSVRDTAGLNISGLTFEVASGIVTNAGTLHVGSGVLNIASGATLYNTDTNKITGGYTEILNNGKIINYGTIDDNGNGIFVINNTAGQIYNVGAATITMRIDGNPAVNIPPPSPLTFTDSDAYNIPASTVGTPITPSIDVTGGVAGGKNPYKFTAAGLPQGITISEVGIISGTPTTEGPAGTAAITVTDDLLATKSIEIAYGAVSRPVDAFVPVTGITLIQRYAVEDTPLTLTGIVIPANATDKNIVWRVLDEGDTFASIIGDTLTARYYGVVWVTATIENGKAIGVPYTQNFSIEVEPWEDYGIRNRDGCDDGGGGCNAGFGATTLLLLATAALILRKRD